MEKKHTTADAVTVTIIIIISLLADNIINF